MEGHSETQEPSADSVDAVALSLAERVLPGRSKRTDFPLIPSKVALLVIDIQQYLSKPSDIQEGEEDSYFYNVALPRTVSNIEKLLKSVRSHRDQGSDQTGCEVIFTYLEALTKDCRDVSLDYKLSGPQLATLPTAPSSPATFLDKVQPARCTGKGDICIPKTSCSVFMSTNLHYVLQNLHVEQLLVCGQLTDQCVESAVRDAADLGYFVSVVEDACAAKSENSHNKGLSGMKAFSRIVTTQQVIEELVSPKIAFIPPVLSATPPASDDAIEMNGDSTPAPVTTEQSQSSIDIKDTALWKPPNDPRAVTATLLRTLRVAGVKFLRFLTVDAFNSTRCKVVPLDRLLKEGDKVTLIDKVAIAEVCFAGLPTFGDFMTEGTNLDAKRSLAVHPDLSSIRILPYATKTALVMGTAHDQFTGELSPLCTRGLLSRVIQTAEQDYGITFTIGAEIEFCLHHDKPPFDAVDQSVFANTSTVNEQEDFIGDLYDQLQQQDIELELLHSESAPGQLEVVLPYQRDPLKLADNVVLARETISAVARAHRMKALFLPKIHEMKAGNGMHVHLSFRDLNSDTSNPETQNAFPHPHVEGEMSSKGKSFLEGVLTHLQALTALTMPTANSFKRVGPGCWTGHCVCWALDDKEVPLRISADACGNVRDVELKLMDSTCNIYLALAGIFASGLDGIARELKLRALYDPESHEPNDGLPTSLKESLQCLRQDSFVSNVMGDKLSTAYIAIREAEAEHASKLSLEEEVQISCRRT